MAISPTADQASQVATILAIDLGGQGPSAALYNDVGDCLLYQHRECTAQTSDSGHRVEYNADDYINAVVATLKSLQSYPDLTDQLVAGIASQGSSFVCWDSISGRALTPIISWQDTRARAEVSSITETLQDPSITTITGLTASAHFGASKFAWCLEHLPDVQNANSRGQLSFGPLGSYLLFILTQGKHHFCDPGTAQRTLLWDIRSSDWSNKLCQAFRIPPKALPGLRQNIDDYGLATFGHLGRQPIKMRAMHRDQNSSLYADGNLNQQTLYINMGTGVFAQRTTDGAATPEGLLLSPALFSDGQRECVWEGSVNGGASALKWLQQQLPTPVSITPEDVERALSQDHSDWNGFFINSISGLGAPYWRTDINAQFIECDEYSHKLCAWIESLLFQLAEISALMTLETPCLNIELSGGMAVSAQLGQRLADITDLPVQVRNDSEASLRGTAFIAANKPLHWLQRPIESCYTPEPNTALLRRFSLWQKAMQERIKIADKNKESL